MKSTARQLPAEIALPDIAASLRKFGELREVIRELRRLAIVAEAEDGKSYDQISKETGYSQRQVIRLASTLAGTVA